MLGHRGFALLTVFVLDEQVVGYLVGVETDPCGDATGLGVVDDGAPRAPARTGSPAATGPNGTL